MTIICRFNPHYRRVIYRNTYRLYPVMANGIRTGDLCGFNKGRSSKFLEGSRVRQTPEEGRRTYRPKRCRNNNKDEDNSPKNVTDKKKIYCSLKTYVLLRLRISTTLFEGFRIHWHNPSQKIMILNKSFGLGWNTLR